MRWGTVTSLVALAAATGSQAAISESFEDVAGLPAQGWVFQNNSDEPAGTWEQGNPAWELSSYSGEPDEYLYVDFWSTNAGVGTISNWAITPTVALDSDTVVSFFTSTVPDAGYADRLQVWLSTSGASTNVGTGPTDVGDFNQLLLDINPSYIVDGYPSTWTQYQLPLDFLATPTTGRIGLRYFVENAGGVGENSYTVGVDDFTVVPEPTAATILLGMAGLSMACRRRRPQA